MQRRTVRESISIVDEQARTPTPLQSSLVFLGVVAAMLLVAVLLQETVNPAAFLWINRLVIFAVPVGSSTP